MDSMDAAVSEMFKSWVHGSPANPTLAVMVGNYQLRS